MSAPRPCLGCGASTRLGDRCAACGPGAQRERWAAAHDPFYDSPGWRAVARRVVDAWIREHGLVCPGFGYPVHRVARRGELAADHRIPRGECSDPLDPANLRVLCRRCNSRKGGRGRAAARAARG